MLVPKVVLENRNGCKLGEEKWAIMELFNKGQFSIQTAKDDKCLEGENQAKEIDQ